MQYLYVNILYRSVLRISIGHWVRSPLGLVLVGDQAKPGARGNVSADSVGETIYYPARSSS